MLWSCKKFDFAEFFKQFWANIMAELQSDRYERGYFHKIWMKYYCLGENHISRTLSIAAAKSQNFVDFTGAQKST